MPTLQRFHFPHIITPAEWETYREGKVPSPTLPFDRRPFRRWPFEHEYVGRRPSFAPSAVFPTNIVIVERLSVSHEQPPSKDQTKNFLAKKKKENSNRETTLAPTFGTMIVPSPATALLLFATSAVTLTLTSALPSDLPRMLRSLRPFSEPEPDLGQLTRMAHELDFLNVPPAVVITGKTGAQVTIPLPCDTDICQ